MTKTAFIFARGGSKGLPRKNVQMLAGKPLIAWSIEHALSSTNIDRVIVSTDDSEIATVAESFGAQVPFRRPLALAGDKSSEWLSWRHALEQIFVIEGKIPSPFISLPATSPLRNVSDIDACIKQFESGSADAVIAVSDAHRNPWFNMVQRYKDGSVGLVCGGADESVIRRQDAPEVFDITTVAYVVDPQFVLRESGLFAGRVEAVEVPVERSIDIDTAHDFAIAAFLMERSIRGSRER